MSTEERIANIQARYINDNFRGTPLIADIEFLLGELRSFQEADAANSAVLHKTIERLTPVFEAALAFQATFDNSHGVIDAEVFLEACRKAREATT